MDLAIQGISIIATFALAHERLIEFLRWWIDKLPGEAMQHGLDSATKGPWAWLPAVGLSLVTHSDAFDAFKLGTDHQPLFFATYLGGLPHEPRAIVGCCIMGLAVTLGSSFWHDLARGLIDLRAKLQNGKQSPKPLATAQLTAQLAQLRLAPAPPVPAETGIVLS